MSAAPNITPRKLVAPPAKIEWPDWRELPFSLAHRNEKRRLVAVEVDVDRCALAGVVVPHGGPRFLVCYESQLRDIERECKDEAALADLERAREMFEQQLAEDIKKYPSEEAARKTVPYSVSEYLCKLPGRRHGVPPLRWMAVHPEPIAAPDTPEARAEQQSAQLVAALLDVVKQGRANKQ